MIHKSISLHCTEGTSDKVYYLQIVDGSVAGKYTVAFQYGKRGKALTWGNRNGTQKVEDVSMYEAERYLSKKVREQEAKGYRVIPDPEDLLTLIGFTF